MAHSPPHPLVASLLHIIGKIIGILFSFSRLLSVPFYCYLIFTIPIFGTAYHFHPIIPVSQFLTAKHAQFGMLWRINMLIHYCTVALPGPDPLLSRVCAVFPLRAVAVAVIAGGCWPGWPRPVRCKTRDHCLALASTQALHSLFRPFPAWPLRANQRSRSS